MEFKKKFKFSIRKLSIGVVSLSLGLTTLAQPIALLGQSNVAHAEENTPAAEKKAGKVTIERVDLDAKPEIQAGEEFKIKIKWVADPGQTNLGGLNSELNFDINTMEYVKVETVTPDGMGNSFINLAAVKKGKSRFGSTPFTNKELEAIFTFKAKRNITAADNYNFVFKAFPAPDGRVRWYTEPDYSGPTPLISSWEGLDADGTISVKLAKEAEATYNATYEFESATAGKELPQVVKDLLPTDNTKYKKDDQVTAKQPTSTEVADAAQDGKWVFKGYEPAGPVTVADKDVEFVGKWEYKANPVAKYTVGYKFESETAGKELPQEVKDLLPTDANEYENGAQVDAKQPAKAEVEVADGKWVFKGYAANQQTVNGSNVEFVGKWEFVAKPVAKYKVTYEFTSTDTATALPPEVLALLPTDADEYVNGDTVNAKQPAKTEVTVANGKWTFNGYAANSQTVNGSDVKFSGTWTFTANPVTKYKATYEFKSADTTKALPPEVLALLPTDNNEYVDNDVVTATQPGQTEVTVSNGKWVFNGYDAATKTVNGAGVKFSGTWTFIENKYKATYRFESTTAGKVLPAEVTNLLPTDANEYVDNDVVTATQPAKTEVTVASGKWVFKGYEAASQTVNGSNVEFVGKWEYVANKYKVSYKFESTTAGKTLPAEVTNLLPTDANEYVDNDVVTATQPAKTGVTVASGKWVFKGYAANSQTVSGSNVEFVGKWEYVANKYKVKYEFYSGTAGKDLPKSILRMLPSDSAEYVDGDEVVAKAPTAKTIETPEGVWTFAGYDKDKVVVNGAEVNFKGKWVFTPTKPTPPKLQQKPTKELPNTGETTTNAGLAGVTLAGLAALTAMRRRNKK